MNFFYLKLILILLKIFISINYRVIEKPIIWSQNKDCIQVLIQVNDCKTTNIQIKSNKIEFT
jgi:hypothetical protein